MSFLYFLEGLRTPFWDTVMSAVTHLGEETVFMAVTIFIFWCVSKRDGYYLLTVGFLGTVFSQFLKLTFRIPRPWVLDPNFTIVESARAQATGYSFPSGHTQSAVGTFGGIARCTRKKWLRAVCIVLLLAVPFSRMYLGVHTPLDVGVAFATAGVLVVVLYPLMKRSDDAPGIIVKTILCMLLCSVAYLLYVLLARFPADIDAENLASGAENAYKLVGSTLGLLAGCWVDRRYIHFDTKAVWWAQALKLIVGLALLIGIKAGLKAPLNLLFAGSGWGHLVRYVIVVFFASAIWPMTFAWFGRLGKTK